MALSRNGCLLKMATHPIDPYAQFATMCTPRGSSGRQSGGAWHCTKFIREKLYIVSTAVSTAIYFVKYGERLSASRSLRKQRDTHYAGYRVVTASALNSGDIP